VKKLLVLVATAAFALSGCGALTSYAAKVNGARITENELDRELNAILGNERYLELVEQQFSQRTGERVTGAGGKETFNSKFVALVLERKIVFELVHQEVVRKGLEVTEEDLARAEEALAEEVPEPRLLEAFPEAFRRQLIRSNAEVSVLQRALAPPVEDAEVRSVYESRRGEFQVNCLRHIVVGDQGRGAELKGRVTRGEDFAAVARSESIDREGPDGGSAGRGGDLGCVPPRAFEERFGAAFEAAVGALQPGQVSDPIQSPMGFHIVQLTERRTRSLEEAASEIRQQLAAQKAPNALPQFIDEVARKADIDVNPRYGRFVRDGSDVGIKTPGELTTTTSEPATSEPGTEPGNSVPTPGQ
jgi:foldase protein PrsA